MAKCDYYLCDVCNEKCFYDADKAEYRDGPDGRTQYLLGGMVLDIAAICERCMAAHICVVVPRDIYDGVQALAERIVERMCEGGDSKAIVTSHVAGFVARLRADAAKGGA